MNNLDKALNAMNDAIKTPGELTRYQRATRLLIEAERLFAKETSLLDYGVGFLEESLEDIIEEDKQLDTIEELTQELFENAWRSGTLTFSDDEAEKELRVACHLEEIIDLSDELNVNQIEKIHLYACEKIFIKTMQIMYEIIQHKIEKRDIELTNRQILIMTCLQMLRRYCNYRREIISENQEIKTVKEIYQQLI